MKSTFTVLSIVLLFILSPSLSGKIDLLKIDPPGPQLVKKRSVTIRTADVDRILANVEKSSMEANIEFATMGDFVIARFGKMEKGEISWAHKVDKGDMTIKFGRSEYKDLLEKIRSGDARPGYQIILSDKKSNTVISSFEVTFRPVPDLLVELTYPVNASPGEQLGDKVGITLKNIGTEVSSPVKLDIVLSSKFQIPLKKYSPTEGEEGVRLLEQGSMNVPVLEPGKEMELKANPGLILPPDLENGRYYLGAVLDPERSAVDGSPDNNVFRGFIVIAPKEPKKITMTLSGSMLYYTPKTFGLEIRNGGMDISGSREWRKCQIRPYIYHLKHAAWKDFFWEVNTDEKMVWKITGTKFCKKGGVAEKLDIKVIPEGGSTKVPPRRFKLMFGETKIIFEPKLKKFRLILGGDDVAYIPFWKTCKTIPLRYHFKYATWDKHVWEIDPLKKTLKKIPMEFFCKKNEGGEELPVKMELEE